MIEGFDVPSTIATLPSVKLISVILTMFPSPKAPPVLNATGAVLTGVPNILKVMFAATPSLVISSLPIVLSRNNKLIVPSLILDEKLIAAFLTMSPADTDTASRLVAS